MNTKVLTFNLHYKDADDINKAIETHEADGYTVKEIQSVAGNNFSKYVSAATIIVILQKNSVSK